MNYKLMILIMVTCVLPSYAGWEKLEKAYSASIHCMDVNDSGDVFIGTSRGLYRSTNLGESWEKYNPSGIDLKTVYSLAIVDDVIYCTGYLNKSDMLIKIQDGKHTILDNKAETYYSLIPIDSNRVFNYRYYYKDSIKTDSIGVVYSYLRTNDNDVILFTSSEFRDTAYIISSVDNYNSFKYLDTFHRSYAFPEIDENNRIYTITYTWQDGGGLYYSDDTLKTIHIKSKLSSFKWAMKYLDSGEFVLSTREGLLKSTDYGETWHSTNIIDNRIDNIVFTKNTLFAISDTCSSVYKSTDRGETWTLVNIGLTNNYFRSVYKFSESEIIASDDHKIYSIREEGKVCEVLLQPHNMDHGNGITILNPNINGYIYYTYIVAPRNDFCVYRMERSSKRIDSLCEIQITSNIITIDTNFYFITGEFSYKNRFWRTSDFKNFSKIELDKKIEDAGNTDIFLYPKDSVCIVSFKKLFISKDSLKTFDNLSMKGLFSTVKNFSLNSSGYLFAIGNYRIKRLTTFGEEWFDIINDEKMNNEYISDYFITDNDIIYAAASFGVFKVNSNGSSESCELIEDESLGCKEVDYIIDDNAGNLYAFTNGGGMYILKNYQYELYPAPIQIFPYDYQIFYDNSNLNLKCFNMPNADSYRCQLTVDYPENAHIFIVDTMLTDVSNISIKGLKYGWEYYWRVKAFYGSNESEWSPIWSFLLKHPVGVETINSNIEIYPNPTSTFVHIKSNDRIGNLRIYDLCGFLVKELTIESDSIDIDVNSMSNGIYNIYIQNNGFFKIIIAR